MRLARRQPRPRRQRRSRRSWECSRRRGVHSMTSPMLCQCQSEQCMPDGHCRSVLEMVRLVPSRYRALYLQSVQPQVGTTYCTYRVSRQRPEGWILWGSVQWVLVVPMYTCVVCEQHMEDRNRRREPSATMAHFFKLICLYNVIGNRPSF